MFERIKKLFLFDTSACGDVAKVRSQVTDDDRKFAVIWSSAEIIYWGFCLIMSFREKSFGLCRTAYLFGIILAFFAWICTVLFMRRLPRLIHPAKALIYTSLLGGSLLIAWFMLQANEGTIMIFAAMLIAPVFFVSNTLTNLIMAVADIIAASLLLSHGIEPEVCRWAVTDLIIFSSIGVTLGHFINKARFERYVFAESAVQLAESNAKLAQLQTRYANYDQMTELRNRRKFSEIEDIFKNDMPPYCCLVMVDINGLKKTNDTLGHEAGDELIIGTGDCLQKHFSEIGSVYRLGGDEFCIILTDPEVKVEKYLRRLDEDGRKWKGRFVDGISVSYGYASTEEFSDFRAIMKAADQRMYASKKEYYLSSGQDRRKE